MEAWKIGKLQQNETDQSAMRYPANADADDIGTTARFYITALEGPWPSEERRKVQKGAPIRLRVQGDGI